MFDYITLMIEIFWPILFLDMRYILWLSLFSTNLSLFIQCNKQTNTFTLHHPVSNSSVHCVDVWYISWLSLLSTNLSLFIQCNKQTNTFTLHRPLNNSSVPCADVWYISWLSLLSTNLLLFIPCNKQTHSPFTVLLITVLFHVLMSDTFHDFRYSVQICHYLYNVTNKQRNKHIHHSPSSQ
jgi:uncharacterized membrane protein YwzB